MIAFARLVILSLGVAWLAPALASEAPAAATWPQWRGPARDGVVSGATWPSDLGGLERVWRVELGKGYPGPIVADDRVFVVESVADEAAQVRGLDRATGATLWTRTWPSEGDVPFFAASNGDWVRSTPAWDGATLYVGDMREVVVALDGESGEVRWRVDLPERFEQPIPDFGFASSPLVDGSAVYVQAANSLVKLDARDGSTVWRTLAHSGKISASGAFSSPVIATLGGKRQVVVLTRHALHGVDPDDGTVLWQQDVPNFRGMNILTPTVVGDAIFTSPYRERSYLYEIGRPAADGPFTVATAWDNPATGYMSSAVVVDGNAYMHLGNRRLDCIDLASGESRWRTSESFGKYWSMVTDGSKILALDETGELILFAADPGSFRVLDRREVGEPETWGHLAVAGDELFVRELEAVALWKWKAGAAAAGEAADSSGAPGGMAAMP